MSWDSLRVVSQAVSASQFFSVPNITGIFWEEGVSVTPLCHLSWLFSSCVKGDFDDPIYPRQQSCLLIFFPWAAFYSLPTSTSWSCSFPLVWFIQQLQCGLGPAIKGGVAGAQPIPCVQYLEGCCWHLCAIAHRILGVAFIGKIPLSLKSRQNMLLPARLQPRWKLLRQQSEAVFLCQHIDRKIYYALLNIYGIFTPEFEQKKKKSSCPQKCFWAVRNDATHWKKKK